MKQTPTYKVTIPHEVLLQEAAAKTVLLYLANDTFFHLDTRIWQLLPERGCLRAVYDAMPDKYEGQRNIGKQGVAPRYGAFAPAFLSEPLCMP